MAGLGYACALLLAGAFVRAGAAKLARPQQTVASFRALGVPAAAARAVPVVELAVAVTLLALPRAGAGLSVALLAAFTVVLVRAVRAGVTTACNCFGAARADPVSWADVGRNGLLAVAAAVSATASGAEVPSPAAAALAAAGFAAAIGALTVARRRQAS